MKWFKKSSIYILYIRKNKSIKMITKFDNFINEWYLGPYSATGFKLTEPSTKYNFNIDIKYDEKNEKNVKEILNKYNIEYDILDMQKTKYDNNEDVHKINIIFKSYNKFEATSILNSIIKELINKNILFNPNSIKIKEENETEKKKIGYI